MFILTNCQRKCFALALVEPQWVRIEAKASPHDDFITYLYLNGDTVVKCIMVGEDLYVEFELSEKLTSDHKFLLPKTSKGKMVPLSSSTILKRRSIGMNLSYQKKYLDLYNAQTEKDYYSRFYLDQDVCDLASFAAWVDKWCRETTEEDLLDIVSFSKETRRHVRYREGDVFRFKIGRRLYGYGRILLDYTKMRKQKIPFWDVFMSTPLVCSVYHIMTERKDVSLAQLSTLQSLPSTVISDNRLFYGEFEIIGNLPITQQEDYPMMYGQSIKMGENALCYQCGKVFYKFENQKVLYRGFINNAVSFQLNVKKDVLTRCIEENSNLPYWQMYYPAHTASDLRNPAHAEKLRQIKEQIAGLTAEQEGR